LPTDITQSSFHDEEDFISFEEEFWTAGRSQEKAISLLYMRILRAEYQRLSDIALMPESAGTMLLESVDTCIELMKNNSVGPSAMNDLKFVTLVLDWERKAWWSAPFLRLIARCHPLAIAGEEMVFNHEGDIVTKKQNRLDRLTALLCYVIAHRAAEAKVEKLCGTDLKDNAKILKTSAANVRLAMKEIFKSGEQAVEQAKIYQVSCLVWEKELELVNKYEAQGLISGSQAHHFKEDIDYEKSHLIMDLPEPPEEDTSAEMVPQRTQLL